MLTLDQINKYYKIIAVILLALGIVFLIFLKEPELAVGSNLGFHMFYYLVRFFPTMAERTAERPNQLRVMLKMVRVITYFFLIFSLLGIGVFLWGVVARGEIELLLMAFTCAGLFLGSYSTILKLRKTITELN